MMATEKKPARQPASQAGATSNEHATAMSATKYQHRYHQSSNDMKDHRRCRVGDDAGTGAGIRNNGPAATSDPSSCSPGPAASVRRRQHHPVHYSNTNHDSVFLRTGTADSLKNTKIAANTSNNFGLRGTSVATTNTIAGRRYSVKSMYVLVGALATIAITVSIGLSIQELVSGGRGGGRSASVSTAMNENDITNDATPKLLRRQPQQQQTPGSTIGISSSKEMTNTTTILSTEEPYMSSCLLIMDDSHWLAEWLAYHWTTVNLRYMIIAIDERSRTSPISILDRWKGRIEFELWNDTHFFQLDPEQAEQMNLQEVNLERQQRFLPKCMRALKARNHTYAMFTDTDEYIAINPRASRPKNKLLYRPYAPQVPSTGTSRQRQQRGYVLDFIRREQEHNSTICCFSMGRMQFSPDESSAIEVCKDIPSYLNGSDFMTLRWLHVADDLVGPKNIVDLSRVPWGLVPKDRTHQHRVIEELCPEAGHTWHRHNSLLQVYHYLGTLEQFTFRDDPRLALKDAGRNTRFARYVGKGSSQVTDDLRPWLKVFVDAVGDEDARRLLEGVGRVDVWPSADAHQTRFAPLEQVDQMTTNQVPDSSLSDDDDDIIETDDREDDDGSRSDDDDGASAGDVDDDKSYGSLSDDGIEAPVSFRSEKEQRQNESEDLDLRKDDDPPVIYSVARTDRSGAAVADMMLAHAYAHSKNASYGGACSIDPLEYRNNTELLIHAAGLEDVLFYACPKPGDNVPILNRTVYATKNTRMFTPDYLEFLRSKVRYPETSGGSVVVHVRRGDVSPCGRYANRYLPNSHYLDILNEYVVPATKNRSLPVTVFSESDAFESFHDLEHCYKGAEDGDRHYDKCAVRLDTDLAEAWRAMMTAEYVVLSKSSFSFVPAMLNRQATVIYTPFMQKKLPSWITVKDSILKKSRNRVFKMIEDKCTDDEKKAALYALS